MFHDDKTRETSIGSPVHHLYYLIFFSSDKTLAIVENGKVDEFKEADGVVVSGYEGRIIMCNGKSSLKY